MGSLWWREVDLRGVSNWWKEISLLGTSQSESNYWFSDSIFRKARDGRSTNIWKDPWLGAISLRIRFPKLFQVSLQKEAKVIDMSLREGSKWV